MRALAGRVVGPVADRIELGPLEPADADGYPEFTLDAAHGRLRISATGGVAAAVGLHTYLREACELQVCWDTPLPLPVAALPDLAPTRSRSRSKVGYYLNFCSTSYTTAYWDWQRWEREIDWMALHGITMPLAATGHETVLYDVYRRLGVGDFQVRDFIGGPGYLPFQFMGCLDGFAGTIGPGWLRAHGELGARIIDRERAFGMTPVLPGFTGHVPAALFPSARKRNWQDFDTSLLEPTDPRFADIAARVARAGRDRFGDIHHFAVDTFVETPPDASLDYIAATARTTLAGMTAADPAAVWVMQSWPFSYHRDFWTGERIAALLDAVPDDRLVQLDLWAEHAPTWERTDGYRGKSWVWCTLHNFGGQTGLFGALDEGRDGLDAAMAAPAPPAGFGLAMEGTGTNSAVYELAADEGWSSVPDVPAWLAGFAHRRYGRSSAAIDRAWKLLGGSVYAAHGVGRPPRAELTVRPSADAYAAPPAERYWYPPEQVRAACTALLEAAEDDPAGAPATLVHDLVEATATVAVHIIDALGAQVAACHRHASASELAMATAAFLAAFDDLDALLETRPELRFSSWVDAAAGWAADNTERAILIDNARRMLTVWSTPDDDRVDDYGLEDYAGRVWSGLVGGYYRDRWASWCAELARSKAAGQPVDADRLRSGAIDIARRFLAAEYAAQPAAPPGDAVRAARHFLTTYAAVPLDR